VGGESQRRTTTPTAERAMPIKPSEYLARYRSLAVPTVAGEARVDVHQYRNNDRPDTLGPGSRELKDQMLGYFRRHLPSGSGLTATESSISAATWSPPVAGFSLANFNHAFTGKIGADELTTFLRFFAFWWRQNPPGFPARFRQASLQTSLQSFADEYLGLDCSGFVGAYFRSQYPASGVEPNTRIAHYRDHWRARTRLEDLRRLDVLIWPGLAHIAVIDDPTYRRATPAGPVTAVECNVSQSAADRPFMDSSGRRVPIVGLLTAGRYTITLNARTGRFRLAGMQNVELEAIRGCPAV
jgi:hypothetical protein